MLIFFLGICRKVGGSSSTGFSFNIHKSEEKSLSGYASMIVDEFSWCKNKWSFSDLNEGQSVCILAFDDCLLDKATSVTLRLALYIK